MIRVKDKDKDEPKKKKEAPAAAPSGGEVPIIPLEEVAAAEEQMAAPEMNNPPVNPMKLDPMVAMYKPPEMGPFVCGNCYHFDGQGACNIVEGPIDPEGHCNVWTPPGFDQMMQQEVPEEASPEMTMEAPVEGAVPPPEGLV